jgi:hypothetical protein
LEEAASNLILGNETPPGVLDVATGSMVPVLDAIAPTANNLPVPERDSLLTAMLRRNLPDGIGPIDLSAAATSQLVAEADRSVLDKTRDEVRKLLGDEVLSTVADQWSAFGMIMGQLNTNVLLGEWLHRRRALPIP